LISDSFFITNPPLHVHRAARRTLNRDALRQRCTAPMTFASPMREMDDQPLGEPKVEAGEFAQPFVRLNSAVAVAQTRNLIALRRRQIRNLDFAFAPRTVQAVMRSCLTDRA